MDFDEAFKDGQAKGDAARKRAQQRIDTATELATVFANDAKTRLEELLTFSSGTPPSVRIERPAVTDKNHQLSVTISVIGEGSVDKYSVVVSTEVKHNAESIRLAPIYETSDTVAGKVSTKDGPSEKFFTPAACNYVNPRFQVNKLAFDHELKAALGRLGERTTLVN